MNKVYAPVESVCSGAVCECVTRLIFFLIAKHGKRRDGRYELIVAKCFKSRDCLRGRTERKGQRKAERLIALLREVKEAGIKSERGEP